MIMKEKEYVLQEIQDVEIIKTPSLFQEEWFCFGFLGIFLIKPIT